MLDPLSPLMEAANNAVLTKVLMIEEEAACCLIVDRIRY